MGERYREFWWYFHCSEMVRWRVEGKQYMSYLLFDFLLPLLGPGAAEYWAQLLVVGPL
ncbi:hypothetical protein [Nocardia sp. CA-135398]|uniref:hypothetical protein n=1 Tax=Nocardia sp. CA-135398 TaxID=3239977 RepID=UPI003D983A13